MRSIRTFFIRFVSRVWRLPCLAILATALFPALAGAATIGSGHSGMWYDPARSGEGLQLEILSTDYALVEWYTYDAQGKQRWIQGVGNITGNSIQFPQIYVTQGGKFGPAFNPDDVKISVVGNLSLTFGDCNTGTFKYTAFGQSQTLPIQRLTQTMGAGCAPINGVPGEPVMSYAGQSGSWYNTTRSGEGFDLQWLSNGAALVTWYTYDTSGNQVWLLGVGKQQNGAIVFEQMAITNGPKFGAAYDTAALQQNDWGSLTLTLDCNGGTAHYASNQTAYGSGDLTLTRLTYLQQPACPYVQPKFSDLYDITWEELPTETATVQNPNYISGASIANDGTVAGRRPNLVLWHPDTRTWEDVPRDLGAVPVFISPDGSKVIATDGIPADQSQPLHTLLWQRSTGWQALSGDAVLESVAISVSKNFQFIAGYGHNQGEVDHIWVRTIDGSQSLLTWPDDLSAGVIPFAVSNDGKTAVGNALRFPTPEWPERIAVRWRADGQSSYLQNPAGEELSVASACDADCNIIFGAGLYNYYDPSHPHPGEAWYLKNDGTFGYLGALADALLSPRSYAAVDATSDGSLVVGTYTTNEFPSVANGMFIWTQATGIASLHSLVAELGVGDDDWHIFDSMRLSADGKKILLGGAYQSHSSQVQQNRIVVLSLIPKTSTN